MVAAAVLWGTTGTAQALGPDGTTPLGVGTLRIAVGALTLVVLARGRVSGPGGASARAGLALGAGGVAVYQVSFFAATSRAGVALGTVLAIGSGPLFAGLLDTVRTRRAPERTWVVATTLAVTGGALLVAGGSGEARADVPGIAYALAAGLSYACYSLGAKQLVTAGWPSASAMAAMFGLGAVLLSPLLPFQPLGWVGTVPGVVMILHLGVVTVGLAYLLYGRSLHWLAVSTVVTLSLAEPVTAAVLGVVVLGESLPALGWAGAALVLAGLVLVGRSATRARYVAASMEPPAPIPQPTLLRADEVEGMCEVLLIRHGRSADVVPGTPEAADPPLHPEGERQAAALAARLATKRIDAVYASHLRRAVDTAVPLAVPRGLAVVQHPDLQEVLLGAWGHGEFRRRAAARDPEWVAWSLTGRWDGIPGGEGDDSLRARVTAVVDDVAARHPGGTVAVVAHGGSINAYLAQALGIYRSLWLTVENTSVTVVRVGAGRHDVVVAGDCHHLYDPVLGQTW